MNSFNGSDIIALGIPGSQAPEIVEGDLPGKALSLVKEWLKLHKVHKEKLLTLCIT